MLRTRTVVLLAALVACAVAMPTLKMRRFAEEEYDFMFEKWQSQHGKEYFGAAERTLRREVFADNMDFVAAHQERYEAGEETYEVELNKFADLTSAEFKEMYLGYVPMPNRTLDIEVLAESNDDAVDWRTKGAVTPVKNQEQCGSCWSFSATGAMEGRYQIAKGKLVSLSEQQLVDCSRAQGNQGCNGGLMDYAFTYVKSNGGIDTEQDYSYTGMDGKCNTAKAGTHAVSITGYKDVTPNNEDQLAAAVAQGPVSVAIEADQSGFQMYKSGIFSGTCGTNLDHGVLAVGYGSEASGIFHKQHPYWIVKNSWGANWGDQGYIKLARGKGPHGQCGIAMQPSYPTV